MKYIEKNSYEQHKQSVSRIKALAWRLNARDLKTFPRKIMRFCKNFISLKKNFLIGKYFLNHHQKY